MSDKPNYVFQMDEAFGFLEHIDIPAIVAANKEPWFNQTLCRVNDCVVRLGILKGEFHWHQHEIEDEFFMVVDGQLLIDIEGQDQAITLNPKEGYCVPKGVVHRTRAPDGVVVVMIEGAGVKPAGDD